jgi:hypothetical protein
MGTLFLIATIYIASKRRGSMLAKDFFYQAMNRANEKSTA